MQRVARVVGVTAEAKAQQPRGGERPDRQLAQIVVGARPRTPGADADGIGVGFAGELAVASEGAFDRDGDTGVRGGETVGAETGQQEDRTDREPEQQLAFGREHGAVRDA